MASSDTSIKFQGSTSDVVSRSVDWAGGLSIVLPLCARECSLCVPLTSGRSSVFRSVFRSLPPTSGHMCESQLRYGAVPTNADRNPTRGLLDAASATCPRGPPALVATRALARRGNAAKVAMLPIGFGRHGNATASCDRRPVHFSCPVVAPPASLPSARRNSLRFDAARGPLAAVARRTRFKRLFHLRRQALCAHLPLSNTLAASTRW